MEELNPSILGTKEYWENCYRMELNNYRDTGDEGEIWFGRVLTKKIVNWITYHIPNSSTVLEIGCGNGHLLFELFDRGFCHLVGIDYATSSIELCTALASGKSIQFMVGNFLSHDLDGQSYQFIIDKGTFDAICLNPYEDVKGIKQRYVNNMMSILAVEGLYLIASCNWTKDELLGLFSSQSLVYFDEIDTPKLVFGGSQGSNVTCIIFKKIT